MSGTGLFDILTIPDGGINSSSELFASPNLLLKALCNTTLLLTSVSGGVNNRLFDAILLLSLCARRKRLLSDCSRDDRHVDLTGRSFLSELDNNVLVELCSLLPKRWAPIVILFVLFWFFRLQ